MDSLFTVPPTFHFLSINVLVPWPCKNLCVSPQWQTLSCNSLLNWYKPIFAGEISGSLLVSSNQDRNQRRHPVAPGLVNKQV